MKYPTVDDAAHIAADIARGVAKEDSKWANASPENLAWWDVELHAQQVQVRHGTMPNIMNEASEPLMNEGYEDVLPEQE